MLKTESHRSDRERLRYDPAHNDSQRCAAGSQPAQAGARLISRTRQAKFANLAATKYPSIHAALHRMFDNDLDDRFEAGLDLLISGLEARIDARS